MCLHLDRSTRYQALKLQNRQMQLARTPLGIVTSNTMGDIVDDFVVTNHDEANSAIKDVPPNLSDISTMVDNLAADFMAREQGDPRQPGIGFPGGYNSPHADFIHKGQDGMESIPFDLRLDALEGTGHACGHNLIATASVAARLAAAEIMRQHNPGGKVAMFGTPAEEGVATLLDCATGAFVNPARDKLIATQEGAARPSCWKRELTRKDHKVDFSLMSHPGIQGTNAPDALITAYNALSVLCQQTMPGDLIQGNITNGGARPNVIHASAAGNFVVRAATQARLEELKKKVDACFQAGAIATAAMLKMTPTHSYADHVPNRVLGNVYRRYFNMLSPPHPIPENDDIDSLHAGFSIPPGPGANGPHNPEFAGAAGSKVAFERSLLVEKALTGVALEVLA
ncbi:hypothetical protein DL762_007527 [Monosporascus cannonballus]|uniref:Peptidase M20 domain-containing protein 2 n=1 Tax=Monosporascus cannonballus TaxID=155416 RepID=A0ABY0H2I8_9PEZI|nr:hypothetical protein DL762_007527 [Monosporascus cannonballus]